jgi:hypothetical protein
MYGYRMVIREKPTDAGSRYEPEHRRIAAEALGRPLLKNEFVHHLNGDKHDSRNVNLLICDRSYHEWLHSRMARLYQQEHFSHLPDSIESGASSVGVLA